MSDVGADVPEAYLWAYERSAWGDGVHEGVTFSVGVYQWLPKAQGKGFKKSGTIRVNGYCAEPSAVYAKAEEVCGRLNAAGVRWGAFPEWVQKSYSVPRPTGVTRGSGGPEISAERVKQMRARVMKERLLTQGFERTHASVYARVVSGVVQVIHFHTWTWGGRFSVHLGLHPVYIPVGLKPVERRWRELEEYELTYRQGLDFFQPGGPRVAIEFGEDEKVLEERLVFCAEESLRVFAEVGEAFSTPACLVDVKQRDVFGFRMTYPTVARASILTRLGRFDEAEGVVSDPPMHEAYAPMHGVLREEIRRVRGGGAARVWVTE